MLITGKHYNEHLGEVGQLSKGALVDASAQLLQAQHFEVGQAGYGRQRLQGEEVCAVAHLCKCMRKISRQ